MMYKVLLADDERIILDGISSMIEWSSFETSLIGAAQNGIDAYRLIMEERPDIVISDIKMPGMGGLELIEKVSRDYPSIRFILLTGFGQFEYAKKRCHTESDIICSNPAMKTTLQIRFKA